MEIRPIRIDEVDELVGLWKEFMNDPSAIDVPIPTHEENTRRQRELVMNALEEDPNQVIVAADAGKLIGYAMFQSEIKTPLEISHKVGYIADLYVRPDYRRQGVGRQLLESCVSGVKSKGVTDLQLRVWCMNKRAIALYKQLGFRDRMLTMQLTNVTNDQAVSPRP